MRYRDNHIKDKNMNTNIRQCHYKIVNDCFTTVEKVLG